MNTGVSPNEYIVTCPWCLDSIIIQEENCKIFRHAAKKTGGQVDPHLCKVGKG